MDCSTGARVILLVYFVILTTASALGNALIIIILYPQICSPSKMRTTRHIKIKISLAVSDFLPSISVFPFMIYYLLKHFGSSNPTSDFLLDMAFESQSSIWVNISGKHLKRNILALSYSMSL